MEPPPTPRRTSQTPGALAAAYAHYVRGKVVMVTGVSPNSLGAAFVKAIAISKPFELILAGRNIAKVQQTAEVLAVEYPYVKVRLLELDLSSLATVRTASEVVNKWTAVRHIDVLVNSAGVMAVDWHATPDGYESQLAINYLAPFLFTNLIMGKLLNSKSPRVVMVSDVAHRLSPIRFGDCNFQGGELYNKWQAYGQSKTATSLMAISLAEKLGTKSNLLAFSLHPGIVNTNLAAHIDWAVEGPRRQQVDRFLGNQEGWVETPTYSTLEDATAMYIYAAFDPYLWPQNGSYLENCEVGDPWKSTIKPWATNPIEAEKLWKLGEQLVAQEFNY